MLHAIRSAVVLAVVPAMVAGATATANAQSSSVEPPARAGRLSALLGPVSFQPSGAADWSEASLNYVMTTGDRVYTGDGSRAEVEVGPATVRAGGASDLTMTALTDHLMQLGFAQGILHVSLYRFAPGDSVEVDTPNGALTLLAAGGYRVEVSPDGSQTQVYVERGALEVSGPGLDQAVRAGQSVQLTGDNPIQLASAPRPMGTAFDQWSADRDRRIATSTCARYVSDDIPGCADLNEHGEWSVDPTYGTVWYPSAVAVSWVPYRYGHWVWIEPWGWTWVEDEPWGYAPFHYGRWAYVGTRWGWVPGPIIPRPYYAPALVAFVGGPSFGVSVSLGAQAWFPLGPREPFIPWYHYNEPYLRNVNVTNIRNVTDINSIIHVRNIDQFHYANRGRGITVVPGATFAGGRPVARDIIHVTPAQVAGARIAAHPSAQPAPAAAAGGHIVARAPVAARPRMITTAQARVTLPVHAPTRAAAVAGAASRGTPPTVTRGASPPRAEAPLTRTEQTPSTPRGAPTAAPVTRGAPTPAPTARGPVTAPPQGTRGAEPPPATVAARGGAQPAAGRGGRVLITRNPAAPQNLPFTTREQAMAQHPGRPLEPEQVQNLRAGRPAGPPHDQEVGAHPAASAPPPARGATPARAPAQQPARAPAPPPAKPPVKGRGGHP